MFISGVGGPQFKSWASQIGHSVANVSLPLRHFFKRDMLCRHNDANMDPTNLLHALA